LVHCYEEAFVDVLGTRMHYLHAGSGRPMLLIHGLVGSSSNWRKNIDALAREASVYALDMGNMGKSQRVEGLDASLEATADRVAAAMDTLGLARAEIAGHSHGGAVALMLAARHPHRVSSLILFAPANPFSDVGDRLVRVYSTSLGRLAARFGPYLPTRIKHFALGRMYGDPARIASDSLHGYVGELRVPGTVQHVLAIVRSWFTDMAKLRLALQQVADIPTLLIWGDRDRAVDPASAIPLQRLLQRSELLVVPTAGHIVFEEMPEESNRLMLSWLRRDDASSVVEQGDQVVAARRRQNALRPAAIASRTRNATALQHLSPEA
jgi:pimeloyl-ACP methyl ester carboxylesterase